MYRVYVGGNRYRKFDTLESAQSFCSAVFARTKIVLSIVKR
jgi:viroplasmin and RNaseH domain-containing protein